MEISERSRGGIIFRHGVFRKQIASILFRGRVFIMGEWWGGEGEVGWRQSHEVSRA